MTNNRRVLWHEDIYAISPLCARWRFFCSFSIFAIVSFPPRVCLSLLSSIIMCCFRFIWRIQRVCVCASDATWYNSTFGHFQGLEIWVCRLLQFFWPPLSSSATNRKRAHPKNIAGPKWKQQDNGRLSQCNGVNNEKIIMNVAKIVWNGQNYYEHHSTVYIHNNNNKCIDGCGHLACACVCHRRCSCVCSMLNGVSRS